ncbi:MAG: D amino acid oxidase (DAO) family protein [Gammaproteobacteria bacterium]|nr:MAG: D amino acid oxidase (DAO) family protein [Gammaproteobacteria bacterium]
MTAPTDAVDAVIIGGGFYGCAIALHLARHHGLHRLLLLEREGQLMARASYSNQARLHNGYHYPRSFTTAYRSRLNLPRFIKDWPQVVVKDFTKLYAIARRNSKVTARQFERFCKDIGAPLAPAAPAQKALFEPRLIEAVYEVTEYAFDSSILKQWAETELANHGISVLLNSTALSVSQGEDQRLCVQIKQQDAAPKTVNARWVFNCTYSGLNQLGGDFSGTRTGLKHEIAEMALVEMPAALKGIGVTVMDGPFFSAMPFPARSLHSLSHVRYTPHINWQDCADKNPYEVLAHYREPCRVERMIRDAARYMPALIDAKPVDTLLEIKTVLQKNEGDDGRPILFERAEALPGCYSVLGGKIDNIYDVLEHIDSELDAARATA